MSWLSRITGKDARDRKKQLADWQGAGPGKRFQDATIAEGNRYGGLQNTYDQSRNQWQDLLANGQQAFESSARAAVAAAMPQFNQQLNSVRESAIRRGVQNGELGTSYEGDLASALSKNLDNSIAGQALNLYGTRLQGYNALTGQDYRASEDSTNRYFDANASLLDRQEQERERKQREQMGWANLGVKTLGTILSHGKGGTG